MELVGQVNVKIIYFCGLEWESMFLRPRDDKNCLMILFDSHGNFYNVIK